jgi:hypothetical protein
MAREGWLPPWSSWWGPDGLDQIVRDPILRDGFVAGCRPVPFAMLEELHPAGASLPDVRAAYVGLSEGYADEVELARTLGWPVAELDLDHLAPVSEPNKVANAIEHVVAQWGAA